MTALAPPAAARAASEGIIARLFGSGAAASQPAQARRANRPPPRPRDEIDRAVAAKLLQFWLENRHQILDPLTVNLARVEPPQRQLLLGMAQLALHAAGAVNAAGRERAAAWLRKVGATPEEADDLPPLRPTSALLQDIHEAELAPIAYAVSVALTDRHSEAGRLWLEYLAARLALPPTMVRSVNRRFGK